jgi:hypothetical protein
MHLYRQLPITGGIECAGDRLDGCGYSAQCQLRELSKTPCLSPEVFSKEMRAHSHEMQLRPTFNTNQSGLFQRLIISFLATCHQQFLS